MAFPARFAGRCACGKPIEIGQMIAKDNCGRFVHAPCQNAIVPSTVPARPVYRPAATAIEAWAAQGLLVVAGMDPDRASVQNGVGFNKHDGDFGHAMAEKIAANQNLTDKMWAAVVKIARKYHRQIGPMPSDAVDKWGIPWDRCNCGGIYEFNDNCGAKVCGSCGNHKGLCRCYCGWSASGMDGYAELVEMGETIEPD
jgi:hypothetical protein